MRRSVATDSLRAGVAGQDGNHLRLRRYRRARRTATPTDARARPRRARTAWRGCARSRRGRRRSAPGCCVRIGRATSISSRARRVATPCGRFALAATRLGQRLAHVLLEVPDQQLEHRFGERARVALDQVVVLAAELAGERGARGRRRITLAGLARRRAKGACAAGRSGAALDQLGAAPAGPRAWRVSARQAPGSPARSCEASRLGNACRPARCGAATSVLCERPG